MNCSKCGSEFEAVTIGDLAVMRCTSCMGLWFDMLQKEDLLSIEGSESIDIGDAEVGARFDGYRNARCPECKIRMIHMEYMNGVIRWSFRLRLRATSN